MSRTVIKLHESDTDLVLAKQDMLLLTLDEHIIQSPRSSLSVGGDVINHCTSCINVN